MNKLIRGLSLRQAVAINMIDMVGIGPFITIPFIIGAMNGPQCIIAWMLGALLSFCDGCVWAELGAKWPQAGGSYIFLQNLYGKKYGKLFSFLYIWQTTIQAPLVIASGAIGFASYLQYLVPLETWQQKCVSGSLVLLLILLLYRKITDIGKISVFMGIIVCGTILWLIISGLMQFDTNLAFTYPKDAFILTPLFFVGLGAASQKTIYSFLGYYNVCHLGGEIKEPEINIPKSIFISIFGITVLYLLMQISVVGVIPWQDAKNSEFIVSTFFEKIYGTTIANIATALILFIAVSSLFAVMLGYSRVPYAAAVDGNYFKIFSKLHPDKNFPHVSLLILGGVAFIFSLLFKMKEIISAIIIMRILIQFVSQSAGILLLHQKKKEENFPWRMPLYPLPALIGIMVWLFIFYTAELKYKLFAFAIIASGILLYYLFIQKGNDIVSPESEEVN
ncbi:MAG TPA: amino acid permease [Chitinophagales bacterium]|nr:amino acid permease [Chitinophagales bacterium]